jgi:hypothetical protein
MTALLLAILFTLVTAAVYGAYLTVSWLKANGRQYSAQLAAAAGAFISIASVAPTYAQETTPTLTFDLTPFFDSLNTYLPIFIGLFAIVGGIAGAMALARYVINAVVNAFKGGSL